MTSHHTNWTCKLCGRSECTYLATLHSVRLERCNNCGLIFQSRPSQASKDSQSAPRPDTSSLVEESKTEQEAAQAYLQSLEERGVTGKKLLVIAVPDHPFIPLAIAASYEVEALDSHTWPGTPLAANQYDAAVFIYQLEKYPEPFDMLRQVHMALKPEGVLLVVIPSLDSWSARFFRQQWTEWRAENLFFFNLHTVQAALLSVGFAEIFFKPDRRRYSIQHLYHRARAFPETWLTRGIQMAYQVTPGFLRKNFRVKLPTSGLVVIACRAESRNKPLLSVIMPVYNEQATFETTLNAVLDAAVPEIDKEIIIVESNSTDGTRELALKYQDYSGVRLILEDRPRGKGHAVRVGLEHATGDFILIQDADSEYDVNDYETLIDALRSHRAAFVLGSRHLGDWKIRKFNKQPGIAAYFNLGHTFFAGLMNVLYGQRMKDPFTMYKVFWRECLYGLDFECNRFDFDIELVAKLLRKGYVPLEIPVNYRSRSLREGKKVSLFRDPLTWLRAEFKYRFSKLYAHPNKPRRLL